MKKRYLITGGSGLLATCWAYERGSKDQIFLVKHATDIEIENVDVIEVNIECIDDIRRTLEKLQIDVCVHAAAMTNVETCEQNPLLAHHVNVQLAANMAKACSESDVTFVHISTDHLFAGSRSFVTEDEKPEPLNVYAKTKAEAEIEVLKNNAQALVIRTNFFGWGPPHRQSFSDWIINSLRSNTPINLYSDVYFTPILATELVNIIIELIDLGSRGIFNAVGQTRLSKLEFGLLLADEFGLDASLIFRSKMPIKFEAIKRPLDMSLSIKKISAHLSRGIGDVSNHLQILHKQHTTFGDF